VLIVAMALTALWGWSIERIAYRPLREMPSQVVTIRKVISAMKAESMNTSPWAKLIMPMLIAIGYTMVFGIIGMINFAHGDVFMLSAFIALITRRRGRS
jgi:branched-subunit amino acid ABC-type transport system permease component